MPSGKRTQTNLYEGGATIDGVFLSFHSKNLVNPINVFVLALSLSGLFSSTFTLTFAYISDTVRDKRDRVSAYGLALATFGLSFTIGPLVGGYLAKGGVAGTLTEEQSEAGVRRVFFWTLALTLLDLFYIVLVLPESTRPEGKLGERFAILTHEIPHYWTNLSLRQTLDSFKGNAFLARASRITFAYYTAVHAVVSTLVLYATRRFHLDSGSLGELMACFGLCTMVAEVLLVRIVVPKIGEKRAMRIGLLAFAVQCVVFGLVWEFWQLLLSVLLSLASNLVYPSLTSLVSASVPHQSVGETLGAINGVKALTEGVGPLIFGILMTLSEGTVLPGGPYVIASILAMLAWKMAGELDEDDHEGYEEDVRVAEKEEVRGLLDEEDHHGEMEMK